MTDQPPKKTLLILDDDKFLLDMYALKFSKAGYEVKTSVSTDGSIKLLKDGFVPDIMLVDIIMPGTDGLDMVNIMRNENLAPKAVIIVLTNQGASDDIARAKKLNVDGYIVKATTIPSEVLAEVEKMYANRKNKES